MATGANDANGIWQYGEDDSNTTFSALLNRLGASTSTAIGLIKNDSKGIVATTSGGTSSKSYFISSTSQAFSVSTETTVTGSSMTFTAVAGRLYRFSILANANGSAAAWSPIKMYKNSTLYMQGIVNQNNANASATINFSQVFTGSGSTTLSFSFTAGTYTQFGTSGQPYSIILEDIGVA